MGVWKDSIASEVPKSGSFAGPKSTVPLENLEMSERREGNYLVHGECYSTTGPRG
jgi:hypothetical protein